MKQGPVFVMRRRGAWLRVWAVALTLALTGCATPPTAPDIAPAALPELPPAPAQAVRYTVSAEESELRIIVYRAGRLAALGHNHVVRARGLRGHVDLAPNAHQSVFALSVPVAAFQVDPVDARRDEGEDFSKMPPPAAIEGTTRNMLGKRVLDAERFPTIDIRAVAIVGPAWAPDVTVRITLRGVSRDITVPVMQWHNDRLLVATAVFDVKQSDFGIKPLSVFGGAIAVKDELKVRLRILARRNP